MNDMNNETTSTTVTVTMTMEEWNLITEAIICGICARRGETGIVVDKEQAEQMRDIFWNTMKVSY